MLLGIILCAVSPLTLSVLHVHVVHYGLSIHSRRENLHLTLPLEDIPTRAKILRTRCGIKSHPLMVLYSDRVIESSHI